MIEAFEQCTLCLIIVYRPVCRLCVFDYLPIRHCLFKTTDIVGMCQLGTYQVSQFAYNEVHYRLYDCT